MSTRSHNARPWIGVCGGVTIGALLLGESHAFGPEQGAPVRASLHLVLASLLVLDGWFAARRPSSAARLTTLAAGAALALTAGAAWWGRGQAEVALANAALLGWAGGLGALLSDRWRAARAARFPRVACLAVPLGLALLCALLGRGAESDWSAPWVGAAAFAVGALAWYGALRLDPSPARVD